MNRLVVDFCHKSGSGQHRVVAIYGPKRVYRCYCRNDFAYLVGAEYIRYFDLSGLTLDMALREFLRKLVLAGETQERERILAHFSRRYLECNPGSFNSEGTLFAMRCYA